jgi:hypothetical protein
MKYLLLESQRKHTNKVNFFPPCLSFELRRALFPLQRQANGFDTELQHFPGIGSLRDTIFLELRRRLLKMGLLRFQEQKKYVEQNVHSEAAYYWCGENVKFGQEVKGK